MSSVLVKNDKTLLGQKVNNIDNNRVFLPFNVSKNQSEKLGNLFGRTEMSFTSELWGLELNSITYNNMHIEAPKAIMPASKMTLAKTYVVTMAKSFADKAEKFYTKIVERKAPEAPIFGITRELNLQEAFKVQQEAIQEATTELNLDELNAALKEANELPNEEINDNQVLANNPLGETIIEDAVAPIKVNNEEQPLASQTPVLEPQISSELAEEKVKKRVRKKGNVLVVPVIVVWLGIVLFGTIKLVTMIMS